MSTFTTARDPDYGHIVLDASVKARSLAMVPDGHRWSFHTRAEAEEKARELSGSDAVTTRMIETPDRFEEVADTRYGAAW